MDLNNEIEYFARPGSHSMIYKLDRQLVSWYDPEQKSWKGSYNKRNSIIGNSVYKPVTETEVILLIIGSSNESTFKARTVPQVQE